MPANVEGAIFNEIADPTNTDDIYLTALTWLDSNNVGELNLYVTGLTVALIAVINACKVRGVDLTLWHFNRDTNSYFAQEVL